MRGGALMRGSVGHAKESGLYPDDTEREQQDF